MADIAYPKVHVVEETGQGWVIELVEDGYNSDGSHMEARLRRDANAVHNIVANDGEVLWYIFLQGRLRSQVTEVVVVHNTVTNVRGGRREVASEAALDKAVNGLIAELGRQLA